MDPWHSPPRLLVGASPPSSVALERRSTTSPPCSIRRPGDTWPSTRTRHDWQALAAWDEDGRFMGDILFVGIIHAYYCNIVIYKYKNNYIYVCRGYVEYMGYGKFSMGPTLIIKKQQKLCGRVRCLVHLLMMSTFCDLKVVLLNCFLWLASVRLEYAILIFLVSFAANPNNIGI